MDRIPASRKLCTGRDRQSGWIRVTADPILIEIEDTGHLEETGWCRNGDVPLSPGGYQRSISLAVAKPTVLSLPYTR